ncbi:hypothetical protein A3E73_02080 [Candidatus Beckwithbacteria bacterium RIFCSPHIGHO2_12_FULL_47_17]|uniref:Uncharacterized protein n=1 Tax=Candidatus Beckwithbacteria bacterium RIFCSPHIGHO2_12_FULL_47_17 TaxID=1797460 RepID=A0A1F5DKP9_9BACT|nr:MAG: hypothetical protein A3E73_02080 [Candidatus Beckwithbacteria bacterium RIFCSPHIGHO2_12_FULL_47_17]
MNKTILSKKVKQSLIKYPLISKYFDKAIFNLINGRNNINNLLEFQIIRYLYSNNSVLKNLEKYLGEKEFTNINVPINRLRNNFTEYDSVIFELNVASLLKKDNMTEIFFIENEGNPDIQYKDNGIVRFAEVKRLDELDPEFRIIDNKLEAMSLINEKFKKDFYIQLNDPSQIFPSLRDYKINLEKAVDQLIQILNKFMDKNNLEDLNIKIGEFVFIVSFNTKRDGYFLMYGGDVMTFGSNKDIFLKMSSVYSRFINRVADGIKQLIKKRANDINLIKNDRLYIFLNTARYANFIPKDEEKTINELSKLLGIEDLVTLKFFL